MSKRWITRSTHNSSRAITTCARSSHCYVQRTVDVPRRMRARAGVHMRTARARSSVGALDDGSNMRDATAGSCSAHASDFDASAVEHEAAHWGRGDDHRGIRSSTTFRSRAISPVETKIEPHDARARGRCARDRAHDMRARATSTTAATIERKRPARCRSRARGGCRWSDHPHGRSAHLASRSRASPTSPCRATTRVTSAPGRRVARASPSSATPPRSSARSAPASARHGASPPGSARPSHRGRRPRSIARAPCRRAAT
jgi:hypothetical protein